MFGDISQKVPGQQNTNNTITVTGDLTGTGITSIPLTFNTVNSNVGTFGTVWLRPVITVNGKGLITALTTSTIIADPVTYSNFGGF